MGSDYGRRQRAFEDIFARPVAAPSDRRASYMPQPSGSTAPQPSGPSAHGHGHLQMTPAFDPYAAQQQPPPRDDRRMSMMSSSSGHHGYFQPQQPAYAPSAPQAGPSRASVYGPPLAGPVQPPWAYQQAPQPGYYGQMPPQHYQPMMQQQRPDIEKSPSPGSMRSSPRAPRTSPHPQRPPSGERSPHGSANGLPPMRANSFDLTHDPQLNAYFDQPRVIEEPGEGERTLSPPPHQMARPPSQTVSGEDDNLSPSTERSDQPTSEWEGFAGQQYGAAYLEDSQKYAASMARRSSNDSGNSFFGDRSDHTGASSGQPAQHLRSSIASTHSYRHPEGPRPPPGYPRSSGSLHSAPSYRSSPAPGMMTPFNGYDPYTAQQYQNGGGMSAELSQRRSIDSVRSARVLPTQPKAPSYNDRAMTMSGMDRPDMRPSGPSALITTQRRAPIVYPALLSKVAEAFKMRVMLTERVKDGLAYPDAFDGRDAVDKLAYIIKTTDRNLALLLGRALDAQKFFHDVTYEHRLRDSPYEVYQFRERDPFVSADDANDFYGGGAIRPPSPGQSQQPNGPPGRPPSVTDTMLSDEGSMPSGVFTLLTDCYSPTCTRDRLCYSIACPRRLEQQARLKLKPQPGLKRSTSMSEASDDVLITREPGALWSESVPKDVLDSTDDREKRRQEAINEAIYTERDFVHDMEYLRDIWIKGIRASSVVPETRMEDFITQVFWNVLDVHAVNIKLCDQLNRRQKAAHVVERIGDIYLEHVPHFQPFVQYGAHQLYGKYEFEKERSNNPAFAKFVDDLERAPESRKLELNGYLTKPTTRLARYPLLLEAVLKQTDDDNPDKQTLPKVIKLIRDFLARVNEESGKSENRFNLAQLDQQLVFRPGEAVDLKLREDNREMIFKGGLKKRGGTQSESAELQVFLFDHAVLMVKQKTSKTQEQYKVYRKPIPLELLVVTTADDAAGASNTQRLSASRPRSLMARGSSAAKGALLNGSTTAASQQAPPPGPANKNGYAMTLTHLGRKGYSITLWSPSWAGRKKWLEKIESRQAELRERSLVFDSVTLSDGVFVGNNKVTCAAPFDGGERMVFGTDSGAYLADLRLVNDKPRMPIKVIATPSVTQVDVLEEHGILIVLADKIVQTFFIDHLDSSDPIGTAKRARKIHTNASFFKTGQCLGRTLVCIVKSGAVSSTIKTMEPIEQHGRGGGKKQPGLRKFLQGNADSLRVFKEFYLPLSTDSVHFLKSKLCVGCVKGFEIVDLETLDTQGLLDPADSSLDFVQKRENVKPLAIFRVDGDFLLCYDDFAFYVNKNGWRARSNWLVQWEGHPTSFALRMPYVLAFEPTFVEVRHVDTGALMQIMQGSQLRCLFSDTPPSSYSSYGPPGYPMPQQAPLTGYGWAPGPGMPSPHMQQPPSQAFGGPGRPPGPLARQSTFGPPPQQPPMGPYGRPPIMPTRSSQQGSRSQIIMSAEGTAVLRLHQTQP